MTEPTTNINNNILPSAQLVVKNYPNPFNGKINFLISSPGVAKAKIIIFDCLGRVIELKDIQLMTGENTFSWNSLDMEGKTVSSGVYFFRISTETEKNFLFNKIVLLR
jgi:hypothetical protein